MKRAIILTLVVLSVFMIALFGQTVSAMEAKSFPSVTKGDYIEYIMKYTTDEEDIDENVTIKANEWSMKYTIEKEEKIKIGGKDVDCWVAKVTMNVDMESESVVMGETMKMKMIIDGEGQYWISKESGEMVKQESETTTSSLMDYPTSMEAYVQDTESESVDKETSVAKADATGVPKTIKKGDKWTMKIIRDVNTETKSRNKDGGTWSDWTTSTDTSTDEEETDFEAVAELDTTVPAGKFETIKVSVKDEGETDIGEYCYVSKDGLRVKFEYVDDEGKAQQSMELKSYKIGGGSSSDEKDSFLPGFEAFLVLAAGISAIILVRKFKK